LRSARIQPIVKPEAAEEVLVGAAGD